MNAGWSTLTDMAGNVLEQAFALTAFGESHGVALTDNRCNDHARKRVAVETGLMEWRRRSTSDQQGHFKPLSTYRTPIAPHSLDHSQPRMHY